MSRLIESPAPLLERMNIEVRSEGDMVAIQIGNSTLRMPYETAFQLSQWLRVRAKESKRWAGDTGRHWSVVGVLTNASSD